MSRRVVLRRARVLALALVWSGCGRVGVQLLPTQGAPNAVLDSGPTCPTACANPHGSADCNSGACVLGCAIGYDDCDTDPSNGCEANIMDSADSCGGCGQQCGNPHGNATCSQGVCTPACDAGYGDCDADPDNGCETELSSPSDCGACGVACTNQHGSASCDTGSCVLDCEPGFADCDGAGDNGCETNLASDPRHCGSCESACDDSTQVCSEGSCAPSACPAGLGECDGNLAQVCETDLTSAPDDCGFCGNACSAAHAHSACVDAACAIASCDPGYDDCDGDAATGCESALATSTEHCGSCGNACANVHGTTRCADGSCTPTCSSGFGDCDKDAANGCETPLDTVSDCGTCGQTCTGSGGTPVCDAGVCNTVCDLDGTYALKLSIPVTWPSTSVLSGGSGTFTFWARLEMTQDAGALSGTVTLCGQAVPDFAAAAWINEHYGITYPSSLYASASLQQTALRGSLDANEAGANLLLDQAVLLSGAQLSDPLNDPWPSLGATVAVDVDGDGKPGMTGQYKIGGGYSSPPANSLGTVRAQSGYIALRVVFTLNGTLTSCTQASGSATAQDIDVHTFGCRVSDGSRDCSASEGSYLDSVAPNYATGASSFTLAAVSAGASCTDVRAALP